MPRQGEQPGYYSLNYFTGGLYGTKRKSIMHFFSNRN